MDNIEKIDFDHPYLIGVLETYMRLLGLDPQFKSNRDLENKIHSLELHTNDGVDCYTNGNSIWIGKNSPHLQGDLDERYNIVRTIVGREIGFLRLTDKKAWDKFKFSLVRKYGHANNVVNDILYILEGRRTELGMGHLSDFLKENFFLLNYRTVKDIPSQINTILDGVPYLEPEKKIELFVKGILYMSVMKKIPKLDDFELMSYLMSCFPYVLFGKMANSTTDTIAATEKIAEIIQTLINKLDEQVPPMFKPKDMGYLNPTTIQELKASEEEEEEEKHEEEEDELISFAKESLAKASEASESESESESETIELKSPTVKDFVQDHAIMLDDAIPHEADFEAKIKESEKKLQEPITRELLHDLLVSDSVPRKQKLMEKKEDLKIKDLAAKIDVSIHKGCYPIFKPAEEMNSFKSNVYSALVTELKPIIQQTVRQIKELSQATIQHTLRHKRSGRLDRKSLLNYVAFNDSKVFKQQEIEKKQMEMEILLLVDISGSNGTQMLNEKNGLHISRYQMNQTVAILLHEVLASLKFKHTIWTFHEGRGANDQRFSNIIDRSNCFTKDVGKYLREIDASGCNRDGYAIRVAGNYLTSLTETEKKLLIVLSDGQPAGSGYYGEPAMQDVKAAVEEIESKGTKVVGIFTGSPSENRYFEKMYKNNIFCNNESIFELPKEIKNLLIKEFKDQLSKI